MWESTVISIDTVILTEDKKKLMVVLSVSLCLCVCVCVFSRCVYLSVCGIYATVHVCVWCICVRGVCVCACVRVCVRAYCVCMCISVCVGCLWMNGVGVRVVLIKSTNPINQEYYQSFQIITPINFPKRFHQLIAQIHPINRNGCATSTNHINYSIIPLPSAWSQHRSSILLNFLVLCHQFIKSLDFINLAINRSDKSYESSYQSVPSTNPSHPSIATV